MGNPLKTPSTGRSAKTWEDAVEARLGRLEQDVDVLKADGSSMRATLAGAAPAPIANPKRRKAKLTPQQRKAIRVQTAAAARASKPIGTGKGAVRTKTKAKKR